MSAPPGSRGSRANTRSRGSVRGGSRGRGIRNSVGKQQSDRAAAPGPSRSISSQSYLKPPGPQTNIRSKPGNRTNPNSPQLSSAILSHAGTISKSKDQPWRNAVDQDNTVYKQRMNDLYQTLKDNRERERKRAIKDGFLADPDKPTSLANAITPVGTCQDMCPEFERVERIVQLMVDANEKIPSSSNAETKVPCEELMVKRFRRSAAGYDEQLPSDIRPPAVLQKTLDHLFDSVIGGSEPLANTHKFVWDRTRGIRNDFSIQQVSKVEDLRVAIDCFERIARFHILSLHQLSHPNRDNGEFDHHQEREQLNNTLLSLMYYYDDSRHKLTSPNEAEFRAYCIIFEIQDQRPDLEDRAQNWPLGILKNVRVRTALKLYAAAGNTSDEQGPLRPRTSFSTAQANTRGFFELVQSNSVSYVMACVAEIYFNLVRSIALESIWKAYKGKRPGATKVEDWPMEDVTYALGFDDHDQSRTFCEEHEFEVLEREDGEEYLNLGSVVGSNLKDNNPRRKQIFSRYLVERKKLGRSLPAVINGLSVSDAHAQGLVHDSDLDNTSVANDESLFVNGDSEEERKAPRSRSASPLPKSMTNNNVEAKLNGAANPFNPMTNSGIPSSKRNPHGPTEPVQNRSQQLPSLDLGVSTPDKTRNPFAPKEPPKFNFFPSPNESKSANNAMPSLLGGNSVPKFNFYPSPNSGKTEEPEPASVNFQAGEHKAANPAGFGASSTAHQTETPMEPKSIFSQQPQAPTAPMFSFGGPSLLSQKTSTPESNPNEDRSKNGIATQLEATAPSETKPSPSFDISPLFQSMAEKAQKESQPLLSQPSTANPPSPSPSYISIPKLPQSSPFTPASPYSTKTSDLFPRTSSTPANPQTPLTTAVFNFQTPIASLSPKSSQPEKASQSTATSPTSQSLIFSFAPVSKPQEALNDAPISISTAPAASTTSPVSAQPPSESAPADAPFYDHRPAALDKATDGLVFDEGGLLQQYIEMAIAPIMKSAWVQFEDEVSWKTARGYRLVLLAKKYFGRWKTNTWKLRLMRRGRERRQILARSMQKVATRTQKKVQEVSSSFMNVASSRKEHGQVISREKAAMPPPAVPQQKRRSLPTDLNANMSGALQTTKQQKRKFDETEVKKTGETSQNPGSSHKRSNTIGSSVQKESTTLAPSPRFHHRQSLDVSKLADGSQLSDTILKQARRMAPNTRSDTTRTDYFRLKALGINPETPVIPLTRKRAMATNNVNEATNVSEKRLRPDRENADATGQANLTPASETNGASPDNDDEFFASIHSIRSTLADSTSWFQSERESIERSMTPSQPSGSPPSTKVETAAQRRLRELRERGHTPSRSEIRLRAMGSKSLLRKDFWGGEGTAKRMNGGDKGKGKQEAARRNGRPDGRQDQQSIREKHAIGFAALASQQIPPRNQAMVFGNHKSPTAVVNGFVHPGSILAQQQQQQSWMNADDVVELSD